jgi:dTMP kinase
MHKKKHLFISFEGIEGSGKSYQSQKLYKFLKKNNKRVIFTREPGGSISSEEIRKIILTGHKNKFTSITDTLLYLAARNEHVEKVIKPNILKKNYIICDRFVDSTMAYQVYGRGVNKSLIDNIHKHILGRIKPDITFILKVSSKKAFQRLKKRKKTNRYDKFSINFYNKVQKAFLKIAKTDKKRCFVIDNSEDTNKTEKLIQKILLKKLVNETN